MLSLSAQGHANRPLASCTEEKIRRKAQFVFSISELGRCILGISVSLTASNWND